MFDMTDMFSRLYFLSRNEVEMAGKDESMEILPGSNRLYSTNYKLIIQHIPAAFML